MNRGILALLTYVFAFSACSNPSPPFLAEQPDTAWVEETLAGLSLEEKVGQLISKFEHFSESSTSEISRSNLQDTESGEEDLPSEVMQVEETQEEESKDNSLTGE